MNYKKKIKIILYSYITKREKIKIEIYIYRNNIKITISKYKTTKKS